METTDFTTSPQANPTSDMKLATLEIMSMNKAILFSKEQCEDIVNGCIEDLWLNTRVVGDNQLHSARRQKLKGNPQEFPFDPIRHITKQANDEIYDFKLLGIIDQDFPQIYQYKQDDFYKMHIDINPMAATRKLSFIINLTNATEYEGGETIFLNANTDNNNINEQGTLLVFPAFLPYEIKPVTSGVKNIIIGHIHGAVFR
jgi:PKHD-type hydroxylase